MSTETAPHTFQLFTLTWFVNAYQNQTPPKLLLRIFELPSSSLQRTNRNISLAFVAGSMYVKELDPNNLPL